MTTFEATVSILEQLSEQDLIRVRDMAQRLLSGEGDDPYRPMTEAEWLDKLEKARASYDQQRQDMEQLMGELQRGVRSGEEAGWLSEAEMNARFERRRQEALSNMEA